MKYYQYINRSWVQITARYSAWPGHYNNVGCLVRLNTSLEFNPDTEDKQGTFPYYALLNILMCEEGGFYLTLVFFLLLYQDTSLLS